MNLRLIEKSYSGRLGFERNSDGIYSCSSWMVYIRIVPGQLDVDWVWIWAFLNWSWISLRWKDQQRTSKKTTLQLYSNGRLIGTFDAYERNKTLSVFVFLQGFCCPCPPLFNVPIFYVQFPRCFCWGAFQAEENSANTRVPSGFLRLHRCKCLPCALEVVTVASCMCIGSINFLCWGWSVIPPLIGNPYLNGAL